MQKASSCQGSSIDLVASRDLRTSKKKMQSGFEQKMKNASMVFEMNDFQKENNTGNCQRMNVPHCV
jgi:hypothetical protein